MTTASIKIVGAQPILNHTFTLTCETGGGVELISWMYNWSSLYANDTRNLSMDNTVLTFDPVMFSDNGPYQCVASNPLSRVASNIFMLDVFCECFACGLLFLLFTFEGNGVFQSVKKKGRNKSTKMKELFHFNTLMLQLKTILYIQIVSVRLCKGGCPHLCTALCYWHSCEHVFNEGDLW